jgi:hypothetical protein
MTVTKVNILKRPRIAMAVARVVACTIVLMAAWAVSPAIAQMPMERDIFTVRAVPVDATAVNVTEAREQGLLAGRIAAFWKVIERLIAPEDLERVPEPTAGEVIIMVRDFSISGERSSAVRYISEMSVRFHPGPMRALLRAAGIPFTETVSKPLVVVPLYREFAGGRLMLWEDPNPWRIAWTDPASENGLVPYVLPLGDIDDLTTLSMEQAVAGDGAALVALAARYGTAGTLTAAAEVSAEAAVPVEAPSQEEETDAEEIISVLLTLTARHRDLPTDQMVLSYSGEPGEAFEEVLAGAAQAAAVAVENAWKAPNRVAYDSTTEITALIPLTGIRHWVRVKNQLETVPLIEHLDLQAITRDRAQVTLVYVGDVGQFNLALAQRDLAIVLQGGVWVVESLPQGDEELVHLSISGDGSLQHPASSAEDESIQ